jgi:membrane protease YdiL (CAAX protease family)
VINGTGGRLADPPRVSQRRRRWVTAGFAVAGAIVLGWSLNVEPDSTQFYVLSLVLAGVWTLGSVASGPLSAGRVGGTPSTRRPVGAGIVVGAGLAGLFVLGALVVREIPALEDAVDDVLVYARQGASALVLIVTLVNGVAEELFFRGALYAAVPVRWAVPATVTVYTLASAASGNLMLTFAALVLGTVTALERRATGGVLAPILTHCTWSLTMLLVLPVLFG